MFPPGPWNTPAPSFKYPVPPPTHDPDTESDCVRVSFSREYLPYILGALKQLWLASTWQGDEAVQNLAQDRAIDLIALFTQAANCTPDCPSNFGLCCGDCDMSCIRVDCNCNVFITCPDGSEVQLVTMANKGGQPGAGSGLPKPAGGTMEYCFALNGANQALLPALVNSGDTIQITDTNGAWTDRTYPFWYCPDGNLFILDNCAPNFAMNSSAPIPTLQPMCIIANINGTFYNLARNTFGGFGVFTVPPGIVNAQVVFQANIPSLSTGGGDITFCAKVTNNAIETFIHVFDFTNSPNGWELLSQPGVPLAGHWVSGTGWVPDDIVVSGAAVRRFAIDIPMPATTITRMDLEYDNTTGTVDPAATGDTAFVMASANGGQNNYATYTFATIPQGSGLTEDDSATNNAQTKLILAIECCNNLVPIYDGSCAARKLTVYGEGVDPF